jgi:phenylacetate-coenzyme A ligase PaaK-like adenylate-forming protein
VKRSLFASKQGQFYHSFETFNEEARQEYMRKALSRIIEVARTTPFYRDRLLEVDLHSDAPLKKVPVLTSNDLRTQVPPGGIGMLTRGGLANEPLQCSVFQSGGTTGTPKTSLFSFEEMELINQCNARGFFAVGLNEHDRVANLWAVGGLYMTFVHMNRMLMEYGCTSFPFSNQTPIEFIHGVAKLFDINCFTGITSVVLNCLREIHQREPDSLRIKKMFFGGEHIYDSDRREMQEKFGIEVVQAPGYGTIDSWYLGYQCSSCTNGFFHAFDDMVHLEIVDEETGLHCQRGEVGMLYATALHRTLTPIIRYRVGDKARWVVESGCSCERTTPRFELLGRGDDVLRIGYDSVDYSFIQSLACRIPGASGRIQLEKMRRDGRDQLIVRIETERLKAEHLVMTQMLTDLFLNERPSFAEFLKKGTIWPLVVEWLVENQLPQNPRTGKLIRVIDSVGDT